VDERGTTRTKRRSYKLCAAWSAALALAGGASSAVLPSAPAAAAGGSQVVTGVVQAQFGGAVAPDGSISGSSSTIGVSVTRSVEHGLTVVTIAPRG
jgi:hypothetical protein